MLLLEIVWEKQIWYLLKEQQLHLTQSTFEKKKIQFFNYVTLFSISIQRNTTNSYLRVLGFVNYNNLYIL